MKFVLIGLLALSGCTISVSDTRYDKEELVEAFRQRDQAIAALAKEVKRLNETVQSDSLPTPK